jgi:hypothetical protein
MNTPIQKMVSQYVVTQLIKILRHCLGCLFVFCLSTPSLMAHTHLPTILNYTFNTDLNSVNATATQSAFHNLDTAKIEAQKIKAAWLTEAVTVPWTRLQLERYVKHKVSPTRGARGLALVHVAMYDAYLIAIDQKLEPKVAVSMAAAQVLGYLFVAEEGHFDRIVFALRDDLLNATSTMSKDALQRALGTGLQIGRTIVARAEMDGAQKGWNGLRLQYYGEDRYFGPGTWEPTPPYFYYPPDEPFAPSWQPWVLEHANEFRPTPPGYGSPQYMKDLREIVEIQANLTDEQRNIARYWVDGHGTVTPAGHWNAIAIEEAKLAQLDAKSTIQMFALMNIAMADTFIAVWDTKYHYWTARPSTAAKHALGIDFKSTLITPPFPSYVSGHAGFSGAASRVLATYLPLRARLLNTMAEEAANSRLLAGIHFRHDNEDGLVLGRTVADKVLKKLIELP